MAYDLLDGVKVVELSMYAFAPAAAAVLADWGADVVKIVPPATADPMKGANVIAGLPAKDVGVAFMWEQMNRGKRCIGLDVSVDDGHAVLMNLLRGADVFITNLLPGARRRFRVDVEDVHAVNPNLVYARASGHGDQGPERESGGFDHTDFWARTGIAHGASQAVGEFVPQAGPALGDLSSGAFLAGGIAAALVRRQRTGRGAVVDVSLLSSGIWAFAPAVIASQLYDIDTIPRRGHLDQPNPLVTAYTTRDGRQIYMSGIRTDKHFESFAEIVGRKDLLDDPRFANGPARAANARACIGVLDQVFAERDLADWVERLKHSSTPWAVVQTAAEAARDPQTTANGYVIAVHGEAGDYPVVASPAQFDGVRPTAERAPDHGEHTETVLMDLGLEWDAIERLKSQGVIN
ncbi:CoA transferase [Phenylobacterium sp.]|jgi:crotonobetainyl-CoA:carnitine CoA-transferase CaiB-like acyl-CoA transferase|uniref:CaiB/BaiF CoA transferase family protein n=1 Tax=Phenylobacterium sp. TaxID=1871053 RepID=UPI002F40B8F2